MYILVTNDDGLSSPAMHALARELEKDHEVVIVAPDDQRSACSHSITITNSLTVKEEKIPGLKAVSYSINGTPADCVRIGLDKLTCKRPDIVVSGINRGYNLGMDILYSGTVSAAVEASINKIPSIAVSSEYMEKLEDYKIAAEYAARVLQKACEKGLMKDVVLNINVPNLAEKDIKGIKVCRMGNMMYGNYFVEQFTEDGRRVFDVKGNTQPPVGNDTDRYFIEQGYVTLTPLHYDLTNFGLLKEVGEWF